MFALENLVFLGAGIEIYAMWIYLRETLHGKNKPNRVTLVFMGNRGSNWSNRIAERWSGLGSFTDFIKWNKLPNYFSRIIYKQKCLPETKSI